MPDTLAKIRIKMYRYLEPLGFKIDDITKGRIRKIMNEYGAAYNPPRVENDARNGKDRSGDGFRPYPEHQEYIKP